MATKNPEYVNVILPLAVPLLYTYKVGNNTILPGSRVIVQLGNRKQYTAIAHNLHNTPPQGYEIKEIVSVLDTAPIVNEKQLRLWDWISDYYMCTPGEVMKAALPAGLKLESETHIYANIEFNENNYNEGEILIYEFVKNAVSVKISDITKHFSKSNVTPIIQSLITSNALFAGEEIEEKYKPKTKTYFRLKGDIHSKDFVNNSFKNVERAPKQQNLFLQFLDLQTNSNNPNFKISKKDILDTLNCSAAVIQELVKKEILDEFEIETSRFSDGQIAENQKSLHPKQIAALDEIENHFKTKDVCLLHGVTASGKTEVYIELIKKVIAEGKQVLYLLPEIALTTQITNRLQKVFGNKVGIYHSRLHDNERIEIWNRVSSKNENAFSIILGVRSSIFLPFHNLGAIIIDEEHETSFKQYDPAPRYNARDSAIMLASIHNAKTLLGTATPSIETYYNVLQKKYALVELTERFGNFALPKIAIIDLAKAHKQKRMAKNFSKELLEHIAENLTEKKQVILFQNRRGYSPYVECASCGTIPQCKHCDVSLTYHKFSNTLSCHYCGYTIKNEPTCVACGDTALETMGFGTEKIEDDLKIAFPNHSIARMDLDTTRGKFAYANLIDRFENREIDILIGTQMITKGLDFDNVGLVGILNADNLLHMPDFRSYERGYHLMVQVAGRAGRSESPGEVYIQTYAPKHKILAHILNHDYHSMMQEQLIERKNFIYPPFVRLIRLSLKHRDKLIATKAANYLRACIPNDLCVQILGPEFPPVGKIQNLYVLQILLKVNRGASYSVIRKTLHSAITQVLIHDEFKRAIIQADVDPY